MDGRRIQAPAAGIGCVAQRVTTCAMLPGTGVTIAGSGKRSRACHSRQRQLQQKVGISWLQQCRRLSMEATMSRSEQDRESRIREKAFQLWEENGRPHGRDKELWEQAEDLIGMEDNPQAGLLPNPLNTSAGNSIEEAEIQENYGEVPGRLTDQGDRPQTPLERHRYQ
jgi:hypothetical protein